jgi:hypothetical protein
MAVPQVNVGAIGEHTGVSAMTSRAVLGWLAILGLAMLNGAFRQIVLIPRIGDRAAIASPLLLSALIVVATLVLLPWIGPSTARDAWSVGIVWLGLTLAFEFLAGHYLFGDPWAKLFAEYNVTRGRLWVVVPITSLLAPVVTYALRHRPV